jgi:hypothetical protein
VFEIDSLRTLCATLNVPRPHIVIMRRFSKMAGCQPRTMLRSSTEIQARVEVGILENPSKISVQFDLNDADDIFNQA